MMKNKAIIAFTGYMWKSNRGLVIFSMLFIALIQVLLIYFNSTLEIAPIVELVMSQLPAQFKEMYGEEIMSQVSIEGSIAFGLEHPLVITLISFFSINLVSRNLGMSTDNKFMEIILSYPFSRNKLISIVYVFAMIILLLIITATFLGAVISTWVFHELDTILFTRTLLANANAYLLHLFIMSLTLFFTVYLKDLTKAIRISAVILIIFYFIEIISNFWDSLAFTKWFNFFSYFDPPSIMVGHEMIVRDMLVLGIGSLILFFVCYRIFQKKDIF